jgi:hypothetical protein
LSSTPATVVSVSFASSSLIPLGRVPNRLSRKPRFWRNNETPIAVISTLSRGAFRSGRYASRSIVTPSAAQIAIVPSNTSGNANTGDAPLASQPAAPAIVNASQPPHATMSECAKLMNRRMP